MSSALPELLTIDEAAEVLRVTRRTLYDWRMNGGGPPAFRIGKKLRYNRAELIEWLETQAAAG